MLAQEREIKMLFEQMRIIFGGCIFVYFCLLIIVLLSMSKRLGFISPKFWHGNVGSLV